MSIVEICRKHWEAMDNYDRLYFLAKVSDLSQDHCKAFAHVPNFDNLPSITQGQLMGAATDTGFSATELERVTKALRKTANQR